MLKYITAFFLFVLIASCGRSNEERNNTSESLKNSSTIPKEELHDLINSFLIEENNKGLIVLQTSEVRKLENRLITQNGDTVIDDTLPAPIWEFRFNRRVFNNIVEKGLLDSTEAYYIFESMKPNFTIVLDSSRLYRKAISEDKLNSFFSSGNDIEGFRKLEVATGATTFIILSTPLLNKTNTKAFIAANSYELGQHINRTHYMLEKKNGNWQVVFKDFNIFF
ncbi:hypothetical protein [Pontibacter arcticus]|uniref:Lipoprotein n=1 Tax=Pontibacter arcticus TaxID=2080288 RepID=A0A364RH29_9BACT|nr:hypothetical protein [Pontibacter arcticus]RAU83592.1 hypothetical protein DP923_00495 [Pontibacter arcticus]